MIIKEIKILSEALWESAKTDLNFFSSIQTFIKKLSELNYSSESSLKEANLYIQKIEEYFNRYRDSGTSYIYIAPRLISGNNDSVLKIQQLLNSLKSLSDDEIKKEFESVSSDKKNKSEGEGFIFIGHGRSKLWARVQIFLKDDLNLKTLVFEDESRTSETIINILDGFLNKSSFAILIMTAEDETAGGNTRARQNVIHEAGLFQGRLGLTKSLF